MNRQQIISDQLTQASYIDGGVDPRELLAAIWANKQLIAIVTALFALGGVTYAFMKPDIYQATVLLSPTDQDAGSRLGGQLGGLASIAGISLGPDGSSKTIIAKEVLQSRTFLGNYIKRHRLASALLAATDWDMQKNEWVYDLKKYNPVTSEWVVDDGGRSLKPNDWSLVNKFRREHLSVIENRETGMVTVGVKSKSPILAKQWAEWLVYDLNQYMRDQDIKDAEARIKYLENKITGTDLAGMRQVFYQLIESEMRTVMLANAQQEYIFKTIDPAVVPQAKSEPKRAIISIGSTLLGCMLAMVFVLIRQFFRLDGYELAPKEVVAQSL
jgi:uncharacterized protein involved in exopolysaccharide biosynthesis